MKAATGRYQRTYVVAGCLVCVGVAAADIVARRDLILIPLFVLAPLVTSIRARPRQTFGVGALAIAMAVGFGWINDVWASQRHSVAVGTTIVGAMLAVSIAASRQSRDRQLAASVPVIRAADRLKAALATSRMGEWSWDTTTGTVTWDANVAELFGLDGKQFGDTFDTWLMLIDERDRQQVLDNVNAVVQHRRTFRFDHRCTWPDGSVHWIESIGEPTIDPETDQVVGGFGLAVDVDERHRQVEERTRLFELEHRRRERVEYLASINDVLLRSVDLDEIVHTVTTTIIPAFADWCAIVVSIDRPRLRPSVTVAHRDPDRVRWLEKLLVQYPYDVDGSWGLSAVIRSGEPELVAKVDFQRLAGVDPEVLANVDPASVITVPLVGALGTLGAMQAIRGSNAEPFSSNDLELVVEIGGRVAAALNTAILFQRERTIALTLQHRLLSTLPTTPDWIEAAASYVPATGLEIGGDWFQIIEVGDGRIAAVVGDAVGHGLASAAAMGQLRASFMTAVANDASPAHALAAVDLFAGRVADAFAASAAYILIDESGTAHYASAGHPPILWAPANRPATVVDVPEGGLLGTHTVRDSRTISFESGDLVVMFTDGLIERRDKTIDDGLKRLVDAVEATRHLAPQQMCESIVESLTADTAPVDDIAVLILRRT